MKEKTRQYSYIKAMMAKRRISQEEMATHLGKTKRTVSRYMTNVDQPPIPVLYQIAEKCKCEISELLVPVSEPPIYIED